MSKKSIKVKRNVHGHGDKLVRATPGNSTDRANAFVNKRETEKEPQGKMQFGKNRQFELRYACPNRDLLRDELERGGEKKWGGTCHGKTVDVSLSNSRTCIFRGSRKKGNNGGKGNWRPDGKKRGKNGGEGQGSPLGFMMKGRVSLGRQGFSAC